MRSATASASFSSAAKAVPSYASFVTSLFPADVVRRIGKEKIGREIHGHLLTGMHQAMAAREALGPDRFFDVQHTEFVRQPLVVLERVYEWLGLPLRDETRSAFGAWREKHSSGSHGTHRYTAEEFGLRTEQIREDYDDYLRAGLLDEADAEGTP